MREAIYEFGSYKPVGWIDDDGTVEWAGCKHPRVAMVDLVLTGEVVAQICLDCDETLPAKFGKNSRFA